MIVKTPNWFHKYKMERFCIEGKFTKGKDKKNLAHLLNYGMIFGGI